MQVEVDNTSGKYPDCEEAHGVADDILIEFLSSIGHRDLAELYDKVGKWYS